MAFVLDNTYPELLQSLAGILVGQSHYELPDANGCIALIEKDDGHNPHTLQRVVVAGLPDHTISFAAGKLPYSIIEGDKRQGIWKSVANYRHVSDYIILTKIEEVFYLVYVEMKTGFKRKDHIPQLRCARGQTEHLLYLIEHFDTMVIDGAQIKHRFVKFSKRPIPKGVTQGDDEFKYPTPPACNDDPVRAYQCIVEEDQQVDIRDLIFPTP